MAWALPLAMAGSSIASAATPSIMRGLGIGSSDGPDGLNKWGLTPMGVQRDYSPTLNAGGLNAHMEKYADPSLGGHKRLGWFVDSSSERKGLVNNIASQYANLGNQFGALAGQVTPGFGRLTEARVKAIRDARDKAVGDARSELARRRVLGSSFGSDVISRTQAQFAQDESAARAQSFLEELDASVSLLEKETTAHAQSFATQLDELNLQADTALALQNKSAQSLTENQGILQKLSYLKSQDASNTASYTTMYAGSQIGQVLAALAGGSGGGGGLAAPGTFGNYGNSTAVGIAPSFTF